MRDLLDPRALAGDPEAVEPFDVRARVTVVAAGPWTDQVLGKRLGGASLRPTKGSHIVLERRRLPVDHAVVLTGPRDGRVMFAIPWGPRTIVGTTDTDESEGPDGLEASSADVQRFLNEARALARLNHPNIVPVYEVGSASGVRFLAMELVEGETLYDRICAAGFLDEAEIPYRLQVDDAVMGLTFDTTAILWVRAMDLETAREILDFPELPPAEVGPTRRLSTGGAGRTAKRR